MKPWRWGAHRGWTNTQEKQDQIQIVSTQRDPLHLLGKLRPRDCGRAQGEACACNTLCYTVVQQSFSNLNTVLCESLFVVVVSLTKNLCRARLKAQMCGTLEVDKMLKRSEVAQSCPTLCDPMDCSPPGSSIHGILQSRILERVAISFSNA